MNEAETRADKSIPFEFTVKIPPPSKREFHMKKESLQMLKLQVEKKLLT